MLECALRKKETPEALVRSMMSLYVGANIRVRVDYELSEEVVVNVWMHQLYMLPTFCSCDKCCHLLAVVGVLSRVMFADGLFLISETIYGLEYVQKMEGGF